MMKSINLEIPDVHCFDTRAILSTQRQDYWQDAISQVFVPLSCQIKPTSQFWSSLELRHCSQLDLVHVHGTSQYVQRHRKHIQRHPKDDVLASLMLQGDMGLLHNGQHVHLRQGQFAFYDTSQEYDLNLEQNFEQIVMVIPRDHFEQKFGQVRHICGVSFGQAHPLQPFYQDCLKNIFQNSAALSEAQQKLMAEHLLNMLVCMVGDQYPQKNMYLFEQIQKMILENLADSQLNIHHIAQRFNISHRYVSKLFQRHDTTFGRFVLMQRLEQSKKLLQTTPRAMHSIKQIAYRVGFHDLAYFSRVFKKTYGFTPSDLRGE